MLPQLDCSWSNLTTSTSSVQCSLLQALSTEQLLHASPVYRNGRRLKVVAGFVNVVIVKVRTLNMSDCLCGLVVAFLATDPEARVRFPALPDFLRSIVSGTGPTQPREYN
jgi:hypothetical protein